MSKEDLLHQLNKNQLVPTADSFCTKTLKVLRQKPHLETHISIFSIFQNIFFLEIWA